MGKPPQDIIQLESSCFEFFKMAINVELLGGHGGWWWCPLFLYVETFSVLLEQWFILFLLNSMAQGSLSVLSFVGNFSVTFSQILLNSSDIQSHLLETCHGYEI